MAIDVVTTPYGRPALERLRDVVAAAQAAEALAPVTVVVATNPVGVTVRRLLASGALGAVGGRPGLAGVGFVTLFRLAETLGAARLAGAGRRPVSTPVLAAAARTALAEHRGPLAPVAAHPATEQALVSAHRELGELTDAELDLLAGRSRRAAAVVALHRAIRTRLTADWYDEHDLVAAARAELSDRPHRARALGHVVLHLPPRLATGAAALIRDVGEHAPVTVIAGASGDPEADATVRRAVALLGGASDTAVAAMPAPDLVLAAADADDEVRAVVREVLDRARRGTPLARIAVLYGAEDPYARLVDEHLAAAGIPVDGTPVDTLARSALGRALLGLLRLPDRGFRRRDVLDWLHGAPVRSEGRPVPVAAWTRVARAAGVTGGAEQWHARLERHATALADIAGDPGDGAGAERAGRERATTLALQAFVAGLVVDLDPDRAPRTWQGWAAWAHRVTARYLGGDAARAAWPPREVEAAERVEAAVDRLAGLDPIDPRPDRRRFAAALELELERALPREGRVGAGVLVGHVAGAVGVELDTVFVVGMAEGSFPARRRDDALVPDHERVAVDGALRLRSHRTAEEHHALRAVLAGAGESVLSWPRGDLRRTTERLPSRWLLDAVATRAGRRPTPEELPALGAEGWYHDLPSFAGALARTARPATEQEHRLRSLLDHDRAGGRLAHHPLATADPALARGLALLDARRSSGFTRFDGNLAGLTVPVPTDPGVVVSTTRLEAWARCPHAYLMEHVLRLEAVEDPAEELTMSAIDRGLLAHRVLDRFLAEALAAGDVPQPDEPWSPARLERLQAIAAAAAAEDEARGVTGHPLFWHRDRVALGRELERFLQVDAEQRARHRSVPVASELGFGLPGTDAGAVEIELGDGRSIRVRGSVDRLDRTPDGWLVVDYKTGRSASYERLSPDDPDLRGTRLQLAVYAMAARAVAGAPTAPVHSAYWFLSERADRKEVGYRFDDAVAARIRTVLGTIAGGIADGVFPAHPEPPSTRPFVSCPWCDPDGLGTRDRYEEWLRKRDHPALAGYVGLAEPDEPGEQPELGP